MGVKLAAASGGSIELVPTNTASAFTVTVPAVTATMATVSGDLGTPSALVATNLTGTANSLNAGLGVNQTWQSVSRAVGTTYTNSTGKPIVAAVTLSCTAGTSVQGFTINGAVNVYAGSTNVAGAASGFAIVIPDGATYVTVTNGGTLSVVTWNELR
jgi:hypothetical protein